MLRLPESDRTLLLRSDYSDDAAWAELCRLVEAPSKDGFRAYLTFVNEPELVGKSIEDIVGLVESGEYHSFFFVADREAIQGREHAVIAVDLDEQRGRTFRVIPAQMWSVENNLSLANMDFSEFVEHVDAGGVFRGFEE